MASAPAPTPSSASEIARNEKWYARTADSTRVSSTWSASAHAATRPTAAPALRVARSGIDAARYRRTGPFGLHACCSPRSQPTDDRKGSMNRRIQVGGGRLLAAAIMMGLLVPAGAAAAPARPDVTTGPAANVGQS